MNPIDIDELLKIKEYNDKTDLEKQVHEKQAGIQSET